MKSVKLFVTLMICVAIGSCNIIKKTGTTVSDKNSNVKTTVVSNDTDDNYKMASLLGCWAVTAVNDKKIAVNGDNHPQITFKSMSDSETVVMVIGFNGCNHLNGAWNVNASKLEPLGEFLSTMKACDDAPYENEINQALGKVDSYTIVDDNTITLNSADGSALLTLRKRNLSFLDGAWKVTSIIGEPVPSDVTVKFVIDIDNGKIHGNAGCNVINGAIVVKLDQSDGIEFKDLATTRMSCPDMTVEKSFLLALEQVDTCVEGATSGQAVMKGTDGGTLLTLVRISAEELAED